MILFYLGSLSFTNDTLLHNPPPPMCVYELSQQYLAWSVVHAICEIILLYRVSKFHWNDKSSFGIFSLVIYFKLNFLSNISLQLSVAWPSLWTLFMFCQVWVHMFACTCLCNPTCRIICLSIFGRRLDLYCFLRLCYMIAYVCYYTGTIFHIIRADCPLTVHVIDGWTVDLSGIGYTVKIFTCLYMMMFLLCGCP